MKLTAIIYGALFLGAILNAESAPQGQIVESTVQKSTKPIAVVDIRPSWTTKTGEFHTENNIQLGVQTASDHSFAFVHNFNTNVFEPKPEGVTGLNPTAQDAYFKAGLPALWTSADSSLSLTYAPRVYVPIVDALRDAGMITTVRNHFNLKKTLSSSVSVTVAEIPIIHAYSQAGVVTAEGASAHPVLENRVYLIGDFKLSDKLSVSLPLMFHVTRYRPFMVGAKNDDALGYFMWTFPEVTYAVSDSLSVGLAYYSDNLVDPNLTSLTLGSGLEKGVVQVSLAATL